MIFTVLIMAGTFLYTFTQLLSEGVSPFLVTKLALLYSPGIVSKTFPMAMLLGSLLAFGRLSGDSEIVALRASGVSVARMMMPVSIIGLIISASAYWMTDYLVPKMSFEAMALREDLTNQLDKVRERPVARPLFNEDGQIVGYVVARNFDISKQTLSNAVVLAYDRQKQVESILEIDQLIFEEITNWRAIGNLNLYSVSRDKLGEPTTFVASFAEGAWPDTVPHPNISPKGLLSGEIKDLDILSSKEILSNISDLLKDPNSNQEQIINLQFGYWNKFSVPLAALVFGLVGAPLGIRNHRAGNATGFWLSVIIIFGYMLVTNSMAIMAQGGLLPAYVASFAPICVGLIVALELIRRKNLL